MNSITTSRLVLINAMQDIAFLVIKRNLSYYHSMIGMFLHTVFIQKMIYIINAFLRIQKYSTMSNDNE